MNLLLIWPEQQHAFYLSEEYSVDKPLFFDMNLGGFITDKVSDNQETLFFYWNASGPVIYNNSQEYVCIVDQHSLNYQKAISLQAGMSIQAGAFKLITTSSEPADLSAELFNDPVINPLKHERMGKVEEILPKGGYHLLAIETMTINENEEVSDENILRSLELEYKKYLILDEQHRDNYSESEQNFIVSGDDPLFEETRENLKGKTITECIFDSSALIEKVLEGLEDAMTLEDFQQDDEQGDLLRLLAPERVLACSKKKVSNLVYQDLYQPGLDSQI
ncbi:TagK domain-containing protein [Pantoea sp.]|uniref:TagK domain-containing protein n=1 Tax=Pantoea sp. TaxID=69393 RepID=UPI0028A25129|nr:TagK domain-containing protein [Pantoea sp.]